MSKLRATISYQHCINEKQKSDYVIGPINTNADNTKDTDECILISDEESENRSIFKDDEENDEIDNIYNQTHPTIDIDAKWQIVDLFTKNLELPTLFSNN